jgi:serine/threonine-protein kinase
MAQPMPFNSGTRLGSYEIRSPLGVGGMGEVYRARDSKLGRDVALKVLPEIFARDSERLGRFAREAQVLASLNHPNIAAIYGFEDSANTHALVMELVEGPTLADQIRNSPMPPAEALQIARQICDALEYAHDRGIVHRDLKPANVKITPDGTVKLLDFGLAKVFELQAASPMDIATSPTLTNMATQAGVLLGTPAYMSPEQAKGRPVDRRADIWAFGCVLFEMLTGKMAFTGEGVTDTIAEIIKTDPDWNLLPATTPKPIRNFIQRCLKKEPKQRLQAIGEARITIEEVLAGKDGSDNVASETAQSQATPAKSRLVLVGWIAGFLIGVALTATLAWWLTRPASAPAAMHFSTVTGFAGVQDQPALSPDGRSVAFIANRDGHYNVYVGLIRGGELVQITHDSSMKSRPNWSPDGSTLAYAQLNDLGTMDIWETAALGGSPRRVILNANDPAWTPDGRSLVYQNLADNTVWTSGISGENPHLLVRPDAGVAATEPRVSPDGRMVALALSVGGPYGELGVADISTGKLHVLTNDNALALSPAWSADSRFMYFSSSRGGTLNIWKIGADGSGLRQITAGEGDDAELDVSSDGKRLVFATLRMNIGLSQLDLQAKPGESSTKLLTTDPARNEFGPAYSPDGKRLAFFANFKGVENESIGMADADGSHAVQLVRDSRVNIFPRWSPDGSHLTYSSRSPQGNESEYRIVAITGGAPQIMMPKALVPGIISMADVRHDGRLLYQRSTGEVQAFDPQDSKVTTLGKLPMLAGGILRASPDGNSVVYVTSFNGENDPTAGLWTTDFRTAPRQLFHGWVCYVALDAQNNVFFLKGKNNLNGEVWKVKLDGSSLSRVGTVPMLYDSLYFHAYQNNQIDVSPDGRRIVFQSQQVLQENIGMLDGLP